VRDHTVGRMRAVTVMPVSIGPAASRTLRWQVALAEISSMGSRRVRNCVGLERLVISITWACTQMAPQRSTHPLTALTTHARERGLSAAFGSTMGTTLANNDDRSVGPSP